MTNTLGGLAGGWFTALVLVPHLSLRLSLGFTGIALVILGSLWAWPFKKQAAALGLPLLVVFLTASGPSPAWAVPLGRMEARVLHRQASGVGLIQVIDLQASGYSQALTLLIDGITQGGIDRRSGLTGYEFTEYLARLSWAYHPQAKRALLLGLGTGALATQLHRRGMEVDVAEIEPAMEMVARTYFGLPAEVRVHATDARAYLQREKAQWDVIILDAFAGENAPWYLMSQEGLETIQSHLAPGGRLLVNWITAPQGSPGLQRLEAGLLKVFGEARVYVEEPRETQPLVNACLVAGKGLVRTDKGYPGQAMEHVTERVVALLATDRGAAPGGRITTDDRSDLELEEAELRLAWRKAVLKSMGPELLGD